VHPEEGPPKRTTTLEQQVTRKLLVSVARDGYAPVRIEEPPCRRSPPGADGARIDELPGFTIDFLAFEILPATAANERRLRMSPHPGARIVDGEAIDAAEARHERR